MKIGVDIVEIHKIKNFVEKCCDVETHCNESLQRIFSLEEIK